MHRKDLVSSKKRKKYLMVVELKGAQAGEFVHEFLYTSLYV
jgi:hypothetical protein